MVALPLYTWVIFRHFPQTDDSTSCRVCLNLDFRLSMKKQTNTQVTESVQSESKTPVSLSPRSEGLIIYGSRNLRRERWWLCVHNVHVWLTSCFCTESKEQDVSRPVESKGRSSCECDCVAECRVGGMWGRLSSPAYRSTKDNLTLPLGWLPRLPTWHSFYVLLYCCCLFIPLYGSPKKKSRKMLTTSNLSCNQLLETEALSGWALHVNMRVITVEFFKHYVSCYHAGADSFVAEGSCLGVAEFCKDPHTRRDVLLTVINPPTRSFVWGSSSLVPSCGE